MNAALSPIGPARDNSFLITDHIGYGYVMLPAGSQFAGGTLQVEKVMLVTHGPNGTRVLVDLENPHMTYTVPACRVLQITRGKITIEVP